MSEIHCMIDFETLSAMPNSAVLSLGAVSFDEDGIKSEFYINIQRDSCIEKGLHVQQSTVDWWDTQSDEAKNALLTKPVVSLLLAMVMFSKWWRKSKCKFIWGNGADFDIPILKSCYAVLDADTPHGSYAGRCYRTIKKIPDMPKMEKREGVHHNALDDSISQANHLILINKIVKVLE